MAVVKVAGNRYSIDEPLYQWDRNQILYIHGLSLSSVPEIHFTNSGMDRAIVRQANMDAAGIVSAYIPNSLLQKSATITAYVCVYEGNSFETRYAIEIPVKSRSKPSDYEIEVGDDEVYSFEALENLINNTVERLSDVAYSGDYNDLKNKPDVASDLVTSVNGKSGAVVLKMSDLEQDITFETEESDPTVPAWAKAETKPTYTAAEVGAIATNMIIYAETLPDTGVKGQICLVPV